MARDMPGCDHMAQPDPVAPTLCVEHCKVGQQATDSSAAPALHAPMATVLFVVEPRAPRLHSEGGVTASADPLLAAAPPPHAILHCVWRI